MWIKGYISVFVTALIALAVLCIVTASSVSAHADYWFAMHPRTMDAFNFASMGWIIKLVWHE